MLEVLFILLLSVAAIFMILLILVQRGRGGGLAGALGGMGGSSAFGAKAGDAFTKITIVTATLWILLCVVSVKIFSVQSDSPIDVGEGAGPAAATVTADGEESPAADSSGDTPADAPGGDGN